MRAGLKARVEARRRRNRELGAMDAANRCVLCRMRLPAKHYERLGRPEKYCSADCAAEAAERESR